MTKAKIHFHQCIQDSQELGSDNEYMVSRVFFSIELPDKRIDDLCANIKQTVGSEFENSPLEVGPPQNLKGINIDYPGIRESAWYWVC